MFEFIGFMLGIQYGEKVFNLLGVLLRGAVAILSFFAWLSAWDLLTQYLYISTMYKIIAIALMVLFVVSLCFCAYRAEVKNEHYSKIFPAVWYLITLAVMYLPYLSFLKFIFPRNFWKWKSVVKRNPYWLKMQNLSFMST